MSWTLPCEHSHAQAGCDDSCKAPELSFAYTLLQVKGCWSTGQYCSIWEQVLGDKDLHIYFCEKLVER